MRTPALDAISRDVRRRARDVDPNYLDTEAIRDLRADAEFAERQAREGPFYKNSDRGGRVVTTDPEEIRKAKKELLDYAAECRTKIEKYKNGGAHKAVLGKDTDYKPILRPASFSTLPPGVKWEYVERPWDLDTRSDIPRSKNRYGVIRLNRKLTPEEMHHFDLVEV